MSGLISTPPLPASPEGAIVAADGWWPDVDVESLREGLRIGGSLIPHDRLVLAIEGAIASGLRETARWRAEQAAAGRLALAAIDVDAATGQPRTINGQPRTLVLWKRVVRFFAMAELADTHPDIAATNAAEVRDAAVRTTADDFRRMAAHAVRDLCAIDAALPSTRTAVELI